MAKKRHNWPPVEQEFAAGQLSIADISRKFGVSRAGIHKHMRKAGIVYGSLAKNVRLKVAAKLVTDEVTAEVTAAEAVEQAARRGADVIRSHRADIAAQRFQVATLREQVTKFHLEVKTSKDALELAHLQNTLAAATTRLITLERQAYSLDDPDTKKEKRSFLDTVINPAIADMLKPR